MTKRQSRQQRGLTPWQRRRRRVLTILTVTAAVLAFPLGWRFNLRAEVLQGIADLREQGLPVTLDDLAAWDSPGPEDGAAAAAYDAAFLAYREMDLDVFKSLPRLHGTEPRLLEVPFAPETLHALEKRVEGNEALLERLREASTYPRYRLIHEIDYSTAWEVRSLQRPLEVLFAQACVLAEAGQGDAALEAVILGVKIARASRATPLNQVFNMVTECEKDMMTAVFPILVRAAVSQERLDELLNLARDPSWMDDLQRSITGSRCLVLHSLATGNFMDDPFESVMGRFDRHSLWILKFADEVPNMAKLPFTAWDGYLQERGVVIAFGYPFWWGTPPSETLDPVVVAVLRYRQAHGTLPETLEGLVPEFLVEKPMDTASGNLLTYTQDAASFTICRDTPRIGTSEPCIEFRFDRKN